jgi:hypothetical protein
MENNISNQLNTLQELIVNDSDLRALSKFEDKINIFNIIKNGATEIRHSNILAWLLHVRENHGLGELFVRELIKAAIRNNPGKGNILDWAFLDYSAQIVETEKHKIDILVRFETTKHIIAIENKTKSTEHDAAQTGEKQTIIYRNRVEKDYPEHKKLFIYLTPTGDFPADDQWCVLSYEDILSIIEPLLANKNTLPEVELILSNYCALIKSDVIGKDNALFTACNAVYQNHADALDLLFQYANKKPKNKDSQLIALCNKIYSLYETELAMVRKNWEDPVTKLVNTLFNCIKKEEGFELSQSAGKTYVSFSSHALDQYLPRLEKPNSSWGTTNTYLFWIRTNDYKENGVLRFALEFGGWNLPENTYANQNKIASALKPNVNRSEYQYKIIRSVSVDIGTNPTDDQIVSVFQQCIALANQWTEECIRILSDK